MPQSVPIEHINRFGQYTLERETTPEPLDGVAYCRHPDPKAAPGKIKKSVTI
jgi:hypothetical protein